VVVAELVDDLEEGLERLGIAVRQVGVLEDVAEERRDAGVFGHLGNTLAVEAEHFVATERGRHEPGPAVTGIGLVKNLRLPPSSSDSASIVVHELVDESDGDLLDLGFGVGDFADEDVAGGVDATFGIGVEHGVSFRRRTDSRRRSP